MAKSLIDILEKLSISETEMLLKDFSVSAVNADPAESRAAKAYAEKQMDQTIYGKAQQRAKRQYIRRRWVTAAACLLLAVLICYMTPQLRTAYRQKAAQPEEFAVCSSYWTISFGLQNNLFYYCNLYDNARTYCYDLSGASAPFTNPEGERFPYKRPYDTYAGYYEPFLFLRAGVRPSDGRYLYSVSPSYLLRFSGEDFSYEVLCEVDKGSKYENEIYYDNKIYYMSEALDDSSIGLYVCDLLTLQYQLIYQFAVPEESTSNNSRIYRYYSDRYTTRFFLYDGKLYVADRGLYVMNPDGSEVRQLIPHEKYTLYIAPVIWNDNLYATVQTPVGDYYIKADLQGNILAQTRIYERQSKYQIQSTIIIDEKVLCKKKEKWYLVDFASGAEETFFVSSGLIAQFDEDTYVVMSDAHSYHVIHNGVRHDLTI